MPNFNDSMKAKVSPAAINTGLDRPAGTGSTNDLLYTKWGGSTGSINDAGNAYFNTVAGPAVRASSSTTTTTSTMTCTIPTGTTTGDIMVMQVWYAFDPKTGTFASLPAGWTQRAALSSSSGDGYWWSIYTKTAGASEASVTQTGTNWYCGSMSITSVSTAAAVDVVGLSSTGLVAPSVTTTTSTDLLIGCWATQNALAVARVVTPPVSMTSAVTTAVVSAGNLTLNSTTATQTLTSSGATGTRTATTTGSATFTFCILLAIK